MIRNIFKRILSVASALAIVFTAYPPVIFADDGGLCPHHPEHTAKCGYVEGVSPCGFVCEICNPPEVSDSTEPSDTPEPEVTTSPEEQPPVTTAPEPEESETLPTELIPEPDSSPAEPEVQLMALEAEPHNHVEDGIVWTAWEETDRLPDTEGSYYLTEDVTISSPTSIKPLQNVKLCLNGHKINCSIYSIVINSSSSSLTIYDCGDGELFGNSGNSIITLGGGTLTLESGKITNTSNFANVISCSGGSCYIKGGVVSGGGGINATGGTLTISGGQIIGESRPGIFSRGTLIINGGDISSSSIHGVSVVSGSFNLSGNPTIHSDSSADIDLSTGCTITIDAALENIIPYKITADLGVFATVEYGFAEDYVKNFTSANDDYTVVAEGNYLKLVKAHKHDGEEFLPWDGTTKLTAGKYYLTDNTYIGAGVIIEGDVTLCLNGKTLNCDEDNLHIITSGTSLTVCDCSNGKSGKITTTNERIVPINISSGAFTLESGTISAPNSIGSAIQVGGNSSATIIDGIVESASIAIFAVNPSSTVIVKGGEIKGGSKEMNYGIISSGGNISIFGGKITSGGDSAVCFMD